MASIGLVENVRFFRGRGVKKIPITSPRPAEFGVICRDGVNIGAAEKMELLRGW